MTKGLQVFNNLISDLERPQPSPTSCFLWLMLVLVITVLAYLPALSGEFLNFDDHKIYEQPLITDFNLENFKAILTPQDAGFNFLFNWLTLLTYQLNWLIAPSFLGFIIFAIACHLLQTVFFWKICRRLSSGLAVTVLSTLLFSLHALHVQHVVWQAARFHLLGVTCCLFSAWNYLLSLDENRSLKLRGFNYLLAVLGFLIIAFGRPFYFIYPLTLPVLDLLKRSKFSAKVILNKLPFFFVLAASLGYAYHSGMMSSRVRPEWLGGSLINTFFSNANLNLEYFRQLLIPSESTLVVPINEANGMFATSGCADLLLLKIPPIIPIALFLFIFISLVYLWKSRKLSAPLILFMGIVIVLLHVQNIPPRRGLAGVFAYRYAVLATAFAAPVIALFFIGLFRFFRRHGINTHIVLCLTAGYILFSFSTTVQNVRHFRDSESLWSHHVKMLPNSRAGYYYLGKVYQYDQNDPYRAISAYKKALECPHYWGAGYLHHRLAEAYCQVGEWEKADEELKRIGSRDIAKSKTMRRINATVQENLKMTGSPISTGPVSHDGKRVLFDQVHSVRHSAFSNYTKDSIEYNVVQGYSTLQRFLGELGFSVHNHRFGRITPEVLKDVDVLMVGLMSNEAMPINAEEIETIVEFVRKGGGLQVVSDHTNAYDSADLANRLLADFDIEVLDALIVDKTATKDSWYSPKTFTEHPVTKGISVLVHQAGAALETEYGVAFTDPQAWADRGDPDNGISRFGNKLFEPGETKQAFPVIAARSFGKGRVVVTTDCNLYANSWMFACNNYELARNAFSWLAQLPPSPIPHSQNDILVHEAHPAYFRVNWSGEGYYSFYVNFGHINEARTYLSPKLTFNHKGIFVFDRIDYSENTIKRMDSYLRNGGTVVYLCTEKAFAEPRAELLDYFDIKFNIIDKDEPESKYIQVTGDPSICENVFQLPWIPSVEIEGAIPVVYGDNDSQKIYLMKKDVDKGTIYVVPFKKIFKTKYIGRGTSSRNPDMRQQQIRRLQENLVRDIIENE